MKCKSPECETSAYRRGYCRKHYTLWLKNRSPNTVLRKPLRGPAIERFNKSYSITSDGCWNWTRAKFPNGYAILPISGKAALAHRYSYEIANGPIPENGLIDHMCHNRACVNPEHLRVVTNKQNMENLSKLRSDNTFGVPGINRAKNGRYYAKIQHKGRSVSGGGFDTIQEAGEAARQLRLQLFTHNDRDRNSRSNVK